MPRRPTRITTPPGEILHEAAKRPLALSANKLAAALHVPANQISAIVNGGTQCLLKTGVSVARLSQSAIEEVPDCLIAGLRVGEMMFFISASRWKILIAPLKKASLNTENTTSGRLSRSISTIAQSFVRTAFDL